MLAVSGVFNADLAETQPDGATYDVEWVDIEDPDPTFPYTPGVAASTVNNDALQHVGLQGFAQGAARFSRLEGAYYDQGTSNANRNVTIARRDITNPNNLWSISHTNFTSFV